MCCALRIITLCKYFFILKILYKTVFVNLFSIKIGLLLFSLAICETSTIDSGNILILACSFSSNQFLVIMCHIHHENDMLRDLLVVLLVSSGKILIFSSPQNILKVIHVIIGEFYGRFS